MKFKKKEKKSFQIGAQFCSVTAYNSEMRKLKD